MTFGIDISGNQVGLDIGAAKTAGAQFVIVKAVAAYKPEHTVADGYQSNIDRTIAAGLPKGHYLVPNSRNTPEVSAAFLAATLYRYTPGDVLLLDNEPLDTYATHWLDDECYRFFTKLHELTGAPYTQMWWYCPASLTRSTGPWPKTLGLGVRVHWVSYGDNDALLEPGEEPLLGGGVDRWDVHQFTSRWTVPGYAGYVDGNYSPHPISELFKTTTPDLPAGVKGKDMAIMIHGVTNRPWRLLDGGYQKTVADAHVVAMKAVVPWFELSDVAYDQVKANFTQGLLGEVGGVKVDTLDEAEMVAILERAFAAHPTDVAAIAKATVNELHARTAPTV